MRRLKSVVRSLLTDWPPVGWSTIPTALAKLAALLLAVLVALIVAFGIAFLAIILAVVLIVCIVPVLVMAVLGRASPEPERLYRPHEPPQPTPPQVDLSRLLGPYNSRPSLRLYDAVFEGGGVKAIAQIGALKCFEDAGLRPRNIAGTSGGAIVGALLAAGATSADLWRFLAQMDLTELMDPRWLPNRRWLRRAMYGLVPLVPSLIVWKAAARGRRFQEIMSLNLKQVTGLDLDPTFGDLKKLRHVLPEDTDLSIVATDITRRQAIVLPRDVTCYSGWGGSEPDDMPVALAVRMSMAIPFVFEPVRVPLNGSSATADIVDGGISSNYPIWLFDSYSAAGPRFPTFGFMLDETKDKPPEAYHTVTWLAPYAHNVFQSGFGAIDRILDAHARERTINIPTYDVGTTDFDLTEAQQQQLFRGGYQAAKEKLEAFDWSEYIKKYRGGRARIPLLPEGEEVDITPAGAEREEVPAPLADLSRTARSDVAVLDGVEYSF